MVVHSQHQQTVFAAALGVAGWKRSAVRRLLDAPQIAFAKSSREAIEVARRNGGAIAVWATREPTDLRLLAAAAGVPVARIEDGFIRSIGLGAECLPPASIIVDWSGIYFDPSKPSDLEICLCGSEFDAEMLGRVRRLREQITALGVTKYNLASRATSVTRGAHRTVLVAGQVSDDLSFRLGGSGVSTNLELLRRVRAQEPHAEVIYRPHPDVTAGHRRGGHPESELRKYADRVDVDGDLNALIEAVDAVHVLTSLTGFEALLRGREVVTHGQPFYAGWGLTRDLAPLERRGRKLSLDELVAGALIAYPRYVHPVTGEPCSPETLVTCLAEGLTPAARLLPAARRAQAGLRRAVGLQPPVRKAGAHG